jgi:hypothetical protein
MSELHSTPSCLQFLRELERHAAVRRASGPLPQHAQACADCARHLDFALFVAAPLRIRPAVPAALHSERFFEGILEHTASTMADSGFGQVLADALRKVPAPSETPWPLQAPHASKIDGLLRAPARRVPGWLMQNARSRVAVAASSRWTSRRRLLVLAATIAVLAVFGWQRGRSNGTPTDVQIVFVPVTEMPSVLYPAAVLRQGGIR